MHLTVVRANVSSVLFALGVGNKDAERHPGFRLLSMKSQRRFRRFLFSLSVGVERDSQIAHWRCKLHVAEPPGVFELLARPPHIEQNTILLNSQKRRQDCASNNPYLSKQISDEFVIGVLWEVRHVEC